MNIWLIMLIEKNLAIKVNFCFTFVFAMKKIFLLFVSILFLTFQSFAQTPFYKVMMQDFSYNFYTVCDSAEAYFKDKDKGKGSGYKPFLRWKYENEAKYYPSGSRMLDHFLPAKEFERIKASEEIKKEDKNIDFEIGVSQLALFTTSAGWQNLGPDSISNITGHYASGLGRLEYVEVNKSNAQQIYFGSRSGGLHRTSNGGATWAQNTDFLPASGVNAIATNPKNFDSVLINVRIAENGTSFGIYQSTNGGVTFTRTAFNPTNLGFGGLGSNFQINVIKYHPKIKNLVFVGTDRGIFRSTDNLATWTRLNNSWNVKEIEFHPTKDSIIYLYENYYWGSNKNNIFKSTNLGVSYTALGNITGNTDARINIALSAICPNCIFLSSDNGIWKSTDGGTTFTTTVNPAPNGVSLFYATPNDNDTSKYVSGYVDLFRSTNGGRSFNQCTWWSLGSAQHGNGNFQQNYNNSTSYVHADCNYLTAVNGAFYGCTDGFLVKSTDNGTTWKKLSTKVGIRENYNLGLSQSNHYKSVSGSQDNGTSIKTENGWIEAYGADGMECLIHPLNENWVIGSTQYGGRIRTFNNGVNISGIAPPGHSSWWIAPMFYDPNNHMTIFSAGVNIHKSTDFGTTWRTLGAPASFSGNQSNFGTIAENNSSLIILTNSDKIELSKDSGKTFTSIKGTLPNQYITDVVFAPKNDSIIVVTYGDYQNNNQKIYLSKNMGNTWTNITHNLGNMPILSVIIDHTDSMNIYLGAAIGIYKKSMISTNWKLYNKNLPNVSVKEMEINYGSNTLKAATWGRGMWEYSIANRENFPSIVKTNITSEVTTNTPKTSVKQFVTSVIESKDTLKSVFIKWSYNAPKFNNVIKMTKSNSTTWVSSKPLPDSIAGTKIYFKVFAVGINRDTTETYKFMYTLHPFEYCAAKGEKANGNLFINRFQLANIDNNNTGNTLDTTYLTKKIILFIDSTYTAIADFNTGWAENDLNIWIDYNKDATYSLNERVVSDINTTSLGTGSFKVPNTATEGNTFARVRLGYWDNTYSPCGTTLGEVENYPVEIRKTPILDYKGDTAICQNTSNEIKYTGTVVDSVKWTVSNGAKAFNFNGNFFNTNTLQAGNYSLTIKGFKYGKQYNKNIANAFKILAFPTANAGNDTRVCLKNSVTLTGLSSDSFTWNNGVKDNIAFYPITTKYYVLKAKSKRGCVNQDSVLVVVDTLPKAYAGLDKRICKGNLVTLTGSGDGALSWNNNVVNSAAFTPNISLQYVLTVTNNFNCQNKDSVNVIVDTLPYVNAGLDKNVCYKDFTTLNGKGDGTLTWNNGILNNIAFKPTQSNAYILTALNANNCSQKDTIQLYLTKVDTAINLINNKKLQAKAATAQYQWIDCNTYQIIQNAQNREFTATLNGNYAVVITENNCSDTSSCYQLLPLSLNNIIQPDVLKIYPNPTSSKVFIEYKDDKFFNYSITDMSGKIILKSEINYQYKTEINLENFETGVYFITINIYNKINKTIMVNLIK